MSQIGTYFPDKAAPGTILTLTGNTGGAVSPDGSGNIDVLGNATNITITGFPSSNTLVASLTNFTDHAMVVGNSSGGLSSLTVATNGQIPIGSTGANPVIATLTAGSGISITNGAGSIEIAATGSGGLTTLTGDSGTATESGGNINVTGGGLSAGNSGAVFTGSSDNLQLTFNYLSLPNTTTKDYGTIYFGGSSNTVIHNLSGAFFGIHTGLSNTGTVTNCVGIGNTILQGNTGSTGTVSQIIGIGSALMQYISNGSNLIGIGQNIINNSAGNGGCSNLIGIGNTHFAGTFNIANLTNSISIGNNCLNGLQSDSSDNIAIGDTCFNSATAGSYNVAIGYSAGSNCTDGSGNSSNIYLQNSGSTNDNNVMRLGATGSGGAQVSSTYIAGINGVSVSNQRMVVMDSATEQLGTASIPSGGITTLEADNSGTATGSTVTISGGTTGLTTTASGSTLSFTGILKLANGGTNAALTASDGGIFYSTASAGAILAGTATANQVLLSGSSTTPAWSTATYPTTTTINQLLYSSANNVIGGVTAGDYGVLISSSSGVPSWLANGTTGQVLTATTSSTPSWANAAASSISITGDSGGALTGNSFTFTGGTTGLTFSGATATETLTGTLNVGHGGTGATTLTGLLTGNGTSAITGTAITQYNVLTAGSSNLPNSVSPSSTSGVPLISQGSSSQPVFGTAVVAGGGTGDTSFTAYAPVCGGTSTTGALQSASTGISTSGYVLTSTGSSSLPTFQALPAAGGFTSVVTQTFTSSGTYTPTSGMKYCIIEVLGGGAGGGGCANTTGNQTAAGAGGGAGGYARKTVIAATIGASQTVTIGAGGNGGSAGNNAGSTGGTTSVGTIVSATGGNGGAGGAASGSGTSPNFSLNQGGTGGSGASGDFNATGAPGFSPILFDYPGFFQNGISGGGGSSIFGGGAVAYQDYGTGSAGTNGTGYGSGGSGGSAFAGGTGAQAGGTGAAGIVIITEYI